MMQARGGSTTSKPASSGAHAAPHPAVQAAMDHVSHMAATHAASVVNHIAHVHDHGHSAPAPSFHHFVQHPDHAVSGPLMRAIVAAARNPAIPGGQEQGDGGSSMWNLAAFLDAAHQIGDPAAGAAQGAGDFVWQNPMNHVPQMPWQHGYQQPQQGNGNISIFHPSPYGG